MKIEQIDKLAKIAVELEQERDSYYEFMLEGSDVQVLYSSEDIFRSFRTYPSARAVRDDVKKLTGEGYEFNKLSNGHLALTHKQVQLLAELKGEPQYKYRDSKAITTMIGNLKGGVGKSQSTCSFADYLALSPAHIASRKRVLIIDLDPQGSMTFHYLKHGELGDYFSAITLMSMEGESIDPDLVRSQSIKETWTNGIDIIPCSTDEGFVADTLYEVAKKQGVGVHALLYEKVIQHVEDDYDFILLDCGPHLDAVLKAALGATHCLFVPTTPKAIDFDSTIKFVQRVPEIVREMIEEGYDLDKLKFIKSFINMMSDGSSSKNEIYNMSSENDLATLFGPDVIQNSVQSSDVYARCMAYGKTAVSINPTDYAKYIGVRTNFVDRREELLNWSKSVANAVIHEHSKFGDL
ncbi:ParA family protein [Vibrio lentus]|uniref:ParA family protein n=1 Tax=Vibrio TaxID=662 RepID=UPI000C8371D5|nr:MULTISPECIES: ParA family protein [Vibrio]MCC4837965.1 ParA family protein [Vibrio lentus]PMG17932.1 hypothetical protein BCU98_00940 [Vibrio splendidus]